MEVEMEAKLENIAGSALLDEEEQATKSMASLREEEEEDDRKIVVKETSTTAAAKEGKDIVTTGNSRASKKRRKKRKKLKKKQSNDEKEMMENDNSSSFDSTSSSSSSSSSPLPHKLPPPKSLASPSLSPTKDSVSKDGNATPSKCSTPTNNTNNAEPKTEYKVINYPTGETYRGSILSTTTPSPIRHGHGIYTDKNQNIYEGSWKNNTAHGHGVKIFKHGGKHEGLYKNDKRHGWGKYCWSNGDTYVGEWYKGKMNGRGTFVWGGGDLYEGEWRMGKMHGRGTKRMANGDFYEGNFENGLATGWGKKNFFCGDVHEGTYVKDKRCGFGLYVWVNGDRYVGNWENGRMQGRGVKIMSSGDMYNGQWVADKAQGYGVKLFSNGDRHEGYYEEDKRQGYGTYSWASGDRYMGYWCKGRMCGLGVKFMTNGDSYDGEWFADQAHGFGIKKFANGDTHTGFYRHDVRENEGTYLWANGDEFEGCWKDGEQTGIGEYKYTNGDTFVGRWESGRKHGPGYFSTIVPSDEETQETEEATNGDVDIDPVQQAESAASAKEAGRLRRFFEVWSRGSRMHREEVTNVAQNDLPTVTDMCKPRSLVQIVRARKEAASAEVSLLTIDHQQQRRPLSTLHKESGSREDTLSIADKWRWVWESDANSGVSGFWGRRLRRADITRSLLSVAAATAELDTENVFQGDQDMLGDGGDSNMDIGVQNESFQAADMFNGEHLSSIEGAGNREEDVGLRDPFSQVLFAEHPPPCHDENAANEELTRFQNTAASDNVSFASVGSIELEFASSTNSCASATKKTALESGENYSDSSCDEEICTRNKSQNEQNQNLDIPLEEQDAKKPAALEKRSQKYTRTKPLSFCSSSSSSVYGRRRIVDGAVRLSKRRISGRSVSACLSKRKKSRVMESRALSTPIPGLPSRTLIDRQNEETAISDIVDDKDSVQQNSAGRDDLTTNGAVQSKHGIEEKAVVDSMELSSDIGYVISPSPRHSGGDASSVT